MKRLFSISILAVLSLAQDTETKKPIYNILSLDGGGIRGIITGTVVDYMERYAYNYSIDKQYIQPRDSLRVSMTELFDLLAGTSTGSLLASALVIPNLDPKTNQTQKNKYFAEEGLKLYLEHGAEVFQRFELSDFQLYLGTAILALFGALIGFIIGYRKFHDKHTEDTLTAFQTLIGQRKKQIKGKTPQGVNGNLMISAIAMNISQRLEALDDGQFLNKQIQNGNLVDLAEAEEELIKKRNAYYEKQGLKWAFLAIGLMLGGFLGYAAMPTLYALTKSGYSRNGVELLTAQVLGNTTVNDALTEVCIVAYDYKNREPRIFSKYTYNYSSESDIDKNRYQMEIQFAAQGSAAAPFYFDPKIIGDQVLIDGGVIANNPALFALMQTKYGSHHGVDQEYRVISIGTGVTTPAYINPDKIDKVKWAQEIGNLLCVVDQVTHEHLLLHLTYEYYKFQSIMPTFIQMDSVVESDLQTLQELGRNVTIDQREELHYAIETLVEERLAPKTR